MTHAVLRASPPLVPPRIRKQSLIQTYQFDPSQECKLRADEETEVMFCGALKTKFTLVAIESMTAVSCNSK